MPRGAQKHRDETDHRRALSEIDGCALCYPAFLQLALVHERHRDGVNHAGPYQLAAAIYWRHMGSQLELKRSILAASES